MKKAILTGTVSLLLLGGHAKAQGIPVIDAMGDAYHAIEASQLVQQVAQAVKTVGQLQQIYQTNMQQLQSISGLTNVTGLVPSLNTSFMQSPLPQVGQVLGLVNGTGLSGNALSGLATSFLNQNRYYTPQPGSTDFNATWLNGRASSLAGFQAAITQLFDSSQTRLNGLKQLQAELDQRPTLQQMTAINGRIATEQSFAQVQQSQTLQLMALAQAQQQAEMQKADQKARQDADSWFNSTQALQ